MQQQPCNLVLFSMSNMLLAGMDIPAATCCTLQQVTPLLLGPLHASTGSHLALTGCNLQGL